MFEKEAEEIAKDIYIHYFDDDINYPEVLKAITVGVQKGAEFGYNKANEWHYVKDEWHKLDWEKDFPEADKLIRVRLKSGMEHICETCYYEPAEDEIGYGKLVISFYELNGEWVDDNDVLAWCYIEPFKENE